MKYIVRVDFNPDFVAKKYEERQSVVLGMRKLLGDYIQEDILGEHTYMLFCAIDESGAACRNKIIETFALLFPYNANAIDVMVTEDDGSERASAMLDIYASYIGGKEMLKVCNTICGAMKYAKDKPIAMTLHNMNYLVSIDAGFGFTTILRRVSTMISKIGLYENWNNTPLEYTIGKEDENGYTSANSIIDTLWGDEYNSQVVGLDISYFINREMHDELRIFLKRLIRLQEAFIFIFRVPCISEKSLESFASVINDILALKTISIPPLNDIQMLEYAKSELSLYGYAEAQEITLRAFIERIHREKMDGRFYGLRTADKVIGEMIWAKLSHDMEAQLAGKDIDEKIMTAEDVASMFERDGEILSGFEELNQLVGMGEIKKKIEEIVAQVVMSKKNDKLDHPCIHMRFVGSPGTGKTTVARIVGKIFEEKGILTKGGFFEYEASALIGEYIGQTAPRTRNICRDAYGSVLFIDEAYALDDGANDKGYGRDAITTLIAEMENHRDDMVIIMAGYVDEMSKLMDVNPGLRSRMPFVLEFKNYTRSQLTELFMNMVKKGFELEPDLESAVKEYMETLSDEFLNSKEFANARFVRNLYERTWSKAAYRAAAEGLTNVTIRKSDFEDASQESEFREKLKKESRVGF